MEIVNGFRLVRAIEQASKVLTHFNVVSLSPTCSRFASRHRLLLLLSQSPSSCDRVMIVSSVSPKFSQRPPSRVRRQLQLLITRLRLSGSQPLRYRERRPNHLLPPCAHINIQLFPHQCDMCLIFESRAASEELEIVSKTSKTSKVKNLKIATVIYRIRI